MLGRIDVKVAGFTVYSKEIGFKSVDRAIKNFTDNIEKIKSVADGSAFDPEKIAKNAKSRAISSFRAKLPKSSLKVYDDLVGLSKSVKKARNDTINDSRRRIPGKLVWGDRIFEKCGIGRDEGGDGGKTLEIRGKRRLSARDGGANYQQS